LTLLATLVASAILSRVAHAQAPGCAGSKPGHFAVKIESAPSGAAVYLNDKACPALGVTPWEGKLNSGDYTLIIEAPGYDLATRPFRVAKVRKTQEAFIPLVKKLDPPKIDVRADADKNLFGATVLLDGQPQGQLPMVLTTTAGRHLVQVKKDGFEDYSTWVELKDSQVQTVAPAIHELARPRYGTVMVESDQPDAEIYLDGNRHPDNTPATIANVVEGIHVIEVRKANAAPWKQTIDVKAAQPTKVRAELGPAVAAAPVVGMGVVRVLSDAQGARASVDGTDMGPVPLEIQDVKAGEHVIQVTAPGFQRAERRVTVAAGASQTVKLDLATEAPPVVAAAAPVEAKPAEPAAAVTAPRPDAPPPAVVGPAEQVATQRGLSSFGARALPRGHSTVDFDLGFPYYFDGRITVGVTKLGSQFGLDAMVEARTMFARTELGLGSRVTFVDEDPISVGAFTSLYWGSKLFDDSKRNGVTWDVGGMVSLSALTHVTITGRAFAEVWSDRLCPSLDPTSANKFSGSDPLPVCQGLLNGHISAVDRARVKKLLGTDAPTDDGAFGRDDGARFLLSLTAEIALQQQWNMFFILEGAPFQDSERALFTSLFSASMPDTDPRIYARVGFSYKF
jgi:hypothetical protein